MRYEPNYRSQFFWDSEGRPGIEDLFNFLKTNTGGSRIPRNRLSKLINVELAIGAVAVAIACVIIYVTSKSVLLTLVLGMVSVFYAMGIAALVGLIIARTKFATNYTETVSAKCIGISISGMTDHRQLLKTPVFKYSYGGRNYIAFDGKWSNFHDAFPEIGGDWEIDVNPDDPEDIRWQPGKSTAKFIVIWGVASILFASMMMWVCTQDEDFMAACKADGGTRIETSAER